MPGAGDNFDGCANLKSVVERWRRAVLSGDAEALAAVTADGFALIEDDFSLVLKTRREVKLMIGKFLRVLGPVTRYDIEYEDIRPMGSELYLLRVASQLELANGWKFDRSQHAAVIGRRNGHFQGISSVCLLKNLLGYLSEKLGVDDIGGLVNALVADSAEGAA